MSIAKKSATRSAFTSGRSTIYAMITLAAFGGIFLTSCTTQGSRSYATPKSLCGTQVSTRALESLLPPGGSITQKLEDYRDPSDRHSFCRVEIDGMKVLSMIKEWYPQTFSVNDVASEPMGVRLSGSNSDGDSYTYAERGGVSPVDCRRPATAWKRDKGQLFVTVYSSDPAPPNESAMKELVTSYAKAVSASSECN